MKVLRLGNDRKIISYTPMVNGRNKTAETVYEFSKNRRLEVSTVFIDGKKHAQDKTLTQNGKPLKEIVIEFVNGIRDKIIKVQ